MNTLTEKELQELFVKDMIMLKIDISNLQSGTIASMYMIWKAGKFNKG